jgi:hypothetical protein
VGVFEFLKTNEPPENLKPQSCYELDFGHSLGLPIIRSEILAVCVTLCVFRKRESVRVCVRVFHERVQITSQGELTSGPI